MSVLPQRRGPSCPTHAETDQWRTNFILHFTVKTSQFSFSLQSVCMYSYSEILFIYAKKRSPAIFISVLPHLPLLTNHHSCGSLVIEVIHMVHIHMGILGCLVTKTNGVEFSNNKNMEYEHDSMVAAHFSFEGSLYSKGPLLLRFFTPKVLYWVYHVYSKGSLKGKSSPELP